jgi:hypothetical protein
MRTEKEGEKKNIFFFRPDRQWTICDCTLSWRISSCMPVSKRKPFRQVDYFFGGKKNNGSGNKEMEGVGG